MNVGDKVECIVDKASMLKQGNVFKTNWIKGDVRNIKKINVDLGLILFEGDCDAFFMRSEWRVINEDKEYFIYVCEKCKNQLDKSVMGYKCPYCETWTYHHTCFKKAKIIGDLE